MLVTREYRLSLRPGVTPLTIPISQYDSGVVLSFILNYDGATADISSGVNAEVRGTKADGNGFSYQATYSYTNSVPKVSVTVTEQMVAAEGLATCKIILYKGTPATMTEPASNDYIQLASSVFYLDVEPAATANAISRSVSSIRQLASVTGTRMEEVIFSAKNIGNVSSGTRIADLKRRIEAIESLFIKLKYYNNDGSTVLHFEYIDPGDNATYALDDYVDGIYEYTFLGWALLPYETASDPTAIEYIMENRDLYGVYSRSIKKSTVTFVNSDGTVLPVNGSNTQRIEYGGNALPPWPIPAHPTNPTSYKFCGYYPSGRNITEDTTCTALYYQSTGLIASYLAGTMTNYVSTTATLIRDYAFYRRTNLESVRTSATQVKTYAFSENTALTTAEFTSTSPTYIENNAFNSCLNIESIILRSTTISTLQSISALPETALIHKKCAIYVPNALVNTYKTTSPWSTYANRIYSTSNYPVTDLSTISDSLSTILANEENDTYKEVYSIGDTKKITINGVDYYAQIVYFDESETAKITWILQDSYAETHRMNSTATNENGWVQSEMRSWLENTVLPLFPSEWSSAIKQVGKTYYDKTTSSTLTSTDKLWVPSLREVFNTSSYTHEDSGPVYSDIFNGTKARTYGNNLYLRTAYYNNTSAFVQLSSSGSLSTASASQQLKICIGFCT